MSLKRDIFDTAKEWGKYILAGVIIAAFATPIILFALVLLIGIPGLISDALGWSTDILIGGVTVGAVLATLVVIFIGDVKERRERRRWNEN